MYHNALRASSQRSAFSSQPPHPPAALSMEPLTGLGSAEKCAFIKQVQKLLFEPFRQTRVENKGPRNQSVESVQLLNQACDYWLGALTAGGLYKIVAARKDSEV